MTVNLLVAEFIPTGAAVLTLILTWPNPPWRVLQVALPVTMGLFPVLFYPFARMLWIALDWSFRPVPPGQTPAQDHPRPGGPARPCKLDGPHSGPCSGAARSPDAGRAEEVGL